MPKIGGYQQQEHSEQTASLKIDCECLQAGGWGWGRKQTEDASDLHQPACYGSSWGKRKKKTNTVANNI